MKGNSKWREFVTEGFPAVATVVVELTMFACLMLCSNKVLVMSNH